MSTGQTLNTMRVRDFIVLARTVPEDSRKYSKRICMAGFCTYRDRLGEVFDFHSLRHQFITSLHRADVNPATVQRLARHSGGRLTMRYTHVGMDGRRDAIAKLAAATGANSTGSVTLPVTPDDGNGRELLGMIGTTGDEPGIIRLSTNATNCRGLRAIGADSADLEGLQPVGVEPTTFGSVDRTEDAPNPTNTGLSSPAVASVTGHVTGLDAADLLVALAALPPEQRAALATLLMAGSGQPAVHHQQVPQQPAELDDKLAPGYEGA